MVGMAIADGLGHNFEFMPVRDTVKRDSSAPYFEYPSDCPGGRVHNAFNRFNLRPGQWTDDCSMALCIADSLLLKGDYDGSNIRIWFWNWWFNGLDNAFKRDLERKGSGESLSVGLGGNISESLVNVMENPECVYPRYGVLGEDAGNGSLMRLAPIPIRFHSNVTLAREMGFESSFTTHPGYLAAEACAFVSHVIVRALNRQDESETMASFLDRMVEEYLALQPFQQLMHPVPEPEPTNKLLAVLKSLAGWNKKDPKRTALTTIKRLLQSQEPEGTERCWNWKDVNNGLRIEATLQARGKNYNGYPVSAGYFGAFSIDGLALALHCLYTTTSFNEAIVKVVNYCGDADSTGSICAQLAGAFYGYESIDSAWVSWLHPWDNREIEARAISLCLEGERL